MNKFILGGVMLFVLAALAASAQQPTEEPRTNPMPMTGMMMQNCPMAGAMMGSADVKYEATETGARLIFIPKDPKQLEELQKRVREMAERMGKGELSMMRGIMGDTDKENHDIHHPAK